MAKNKKEAKMKLKTKNFTLRHIKLSDAKDYFESHQDKAVKKGFMTVPKSFGEARKEVKEKISAFKKKKPTGETFVIEIKGKFAGYVEINNLNKKYHEHKGSITYLLKKEFRGKGLMVKAVKLVTNYAFKKYKLKRIEGWCRTFNKASANVAKRSGYKLEGILRKNKKKNGKYMDDMIWAKVR